MKRARERYHDFCNACRYCEGYCATFPALERRLDFEEADLAYLANLCHNCGACYYSCQYAPPHEFQLNFPKMLAEIRGATYKKYAWPGFLASLFERNGVVVSIITALSLALFLLAMSWFIDPSIMFSAHSVSDGSFHAVLSHNTMVWMFGSVSLFVLVAFVVGFLRFWRDIEENVSELLSPSALGHAIHDALRLKYLGRGEEAPFVVALLLALPCSRCNHFPFE